MLDSGFYNMDCMIGMKQFPDKFFELAIVDQLGFQYWGFELDPDYFKTSSERLERAKAQVSLLDIAPSLTQLSL